MTNNSFTSKSLIGKPVEPKLIKQMMKTKLFKTSHQAGVSLIVFSVMCWILTLSILSFFFVKQYQLSKEIELTQEAINRIDPVLYEGIFSENAEINGQETTDETQRETPEQQDEDEVLDSANSESSAVLEEAAL